MDVDISQCHTPGNDWSPGSATAAQICQAGNYFISGEREKMYPKAVSDILLELLMVSLKFEGCKPVEASGVTGADTRAGLHQARCNYLMLMDQCKNEQLKHSY